jgi:hypothetical protein
VKDLVNLLVSLSITIAKTLNNFLNFFIKLLRSPSIEGLFVGHHERHQSKKHKKKEQG